MAAVPLSRAARVRVPRGASGVIWLRLVSAEIPHLSSSAPVPALVALRGGTAAGRGLRPRRRLVGRARGQGGAPDRGHGRAGSSGDLWDLPARARRRAQAASSHPLHRRRPRRLDRDRSRSRARLPRFHPHPLLTLALLLILAVAWRRRAGRLIFLGLAFGVSTHLLRDAGTGNGVPLLWPLADGSAQIPYLVYFAILCGLAAISVWAPEGRARPRPGVSPG